MYPVSQDVINLFKANQYQQAKVEVFTPAANVLEPVNGVSATPDLTIGSDRILQNGLVVDRYCVTGEKLEIGTAIAAELTLKLNNRDGYFDDTVFKGKWLKAQVGIKDWSDDTAAITWIPLGWFVVDSAPRKLSTITVSALDFMTLADVVSTPRQISAFATFLKYQNLGHALEQETFGSALAPYKTVIDSALQERANGFTSDFLPLPGAGNNDIIAGVPAAATWLSNLEEGERTRRQSVIWAAQILGACAYIDYTGALHFGWFQDSEITVTPAERYSSDMAEEDVILTGVSYTEYAEQTESEGDETVEYESDKTYLAGNTTGLVLDITNNPFVKGKDIETFLSGLYDQIAGTAYRPFEAKVKPCPYLWPMDRIAYVDAEGVSHSTIITNITFTVNAPTSIAAKGDLSSGAPTTGTSATSRVAGDVSDLADRVNRVETDTEAFNRLIALKADVKDLTAATGRIDSLETDVANANKLIADKADVADLDATNAEVSSLKADKADVDLLNVVKATIENLLVRGGIITDSLSGVEINATKFLTGVTIIGDVIKAGTLQANRIILTGENGLIYELNVNAGNLTASQLTQEQYKQALDGSVLVASSITTDKLAAGSVTAQVIAAGAVDTNKLAANAVKASNIDAGAITTDKLATKAVTTEKIETGAITTDKLAAKAVKAEKIDVENLFAQHITATGSITGAKLIGAILSGENINIVAERVYDDTDEDGLLYQRIYTQTVIKTVQEQNGVDYLLLKQASVTDDYNDNPPVAANTPYRTNVQYGNGSYIKLTNDELFLYTPQITTNYSAKSYTSFSGSVVSNGTVTVTKKLGMCFINGGITLTAAASGWVTLLDSDKVPGPQNGEAIIMTLPSWKAPTTNPARLRIPADGGLQITRGSANAFWINLAYPIA